MICVHFHDFILNGLNQVIFSRRLPKPKGQTVGSFRKGLTMLPNAIAQRYLLDLSTLVLGRQFGLLFHMVLALTVCACSSHSQFVILWTSLYVLRLGKKIKLSWKLSSIGKMENGGYSLTYETPEGFVTLQSRTVVMTVPSHVASGLLRPISVRFI